MHRPRTRLRRVGRFVVDLKRRRVFQVAVFYLAGGWLLIQVGETVLPILLPAPTPYLRLMVIVVLAGFPVAVALGWIYDITAEGVQRTDPLSEASPADVSGPAREAAAMKDPPSSSVALAEANRAVALMRSRNPADLQTALELWDAVLEEAPAWARAHAGRAEALARLGDAQSLYPPDAFARAKQAARRAIELDPQLAAGHAALAFARTLDRDWEGVDALFRRALELDDGAATTFAWRALHLASSGDVAGALEHARRAHELEPDLSSHHELMSALRYYARDADGAAVDARRALELDDSSAYARFLLALALELGGDLPGARAAVKDGLARTRGAQGPLLAALGHIQATAGDTAAARRTLGSLLRADAAPVPSFALAALQLAVGDRDDALDTLRRAMAEHDGGILALRVHPWLDPLRGDPRFDELLDQAGLVKQSPQANTTALGA